MREIDEAEYAEIRFMINEIRNIYVSSLDVRGLEHCVPKGHAWANAGEIHMHAGKGGYCTCKTQLNRGVLAPGIH